MKIGLNYKFPNGVPYQHNHDHFQPLFTNKSILCGLNFRSFSDSFWNTKENLHP